MTMKDEFTAAMHSEFRCSSEDEIKLRVWSALTLLRKDSNENEKDWVCDMYQITKEQMDQHSREFYLLRD
jgi:hypothetical protein